MWRMRYHSLLLLSLRKVGRAEKEEQKLAGAAVVK